MKINKLLFGLIAVISVFGIYILNSNSFDEAYKVLSDDYKDNKSEIFELKDFIESIECQEGYFSYSKSGLNSYFYCEQSSTFTIDTLPSIVLPIY